MVAGRAELARKINEDREEGCGLALQLEMRTIVSETVARELAASRAASGGMELPLEDESPTKLEFRVQFAIAW